jgi:hypothetical protein
MLYAFFRWIHALVSKGAVPSALHCQLIITVSHSSSSTAEIWSLTNLPLAANAASHEDSIYAPCVDPTNGRPSSCEGLWRTEQKGGQ